MADTLTREAIAFGSQPLSPVPQYWNGSSYEKVQGINGATRTILYDSAGQTFTTASPGTIQVISSAGGTTLFNSANPAIMGIVSSAGDSLLFSATNPGHVEIISSAGDTFTTSTPGLVTVLSASSGGTAVFANSSPAFVEIISSAGGTSKFTTTNPGITGLVSSGTQANAWSANATISAGATSNSFDANNNARISAFGAVTCTATLTIMFELSQDNTNWYTFSSSSTVAVSAGTSVPFGVLLQPGNRYIRLTTSGISATITATIAGK